MHLTIATAGHIDHGKSALIQALTGTNPDRLPEEQARGISIELGFAHARVGDTTLSFIDVPGHERFVRTMLAGVGAIDAVLLVVAADESVMPQTREHLAICRLLDVPGGVIALTKCDVADETLQALAAEEVRALVAGSALAEAPIVPVSARTGLGLDELRAALVRCASTRRAHEADAPVRLPIDRVFTVKGFGTVVTGTLWSGRLSPDAALRLEPGGRDIRVRGLQVHGAPATHAEAGRRVAVNLAGVSQQEVERGQVLVGDGAVLISRRLAVEMQVLPDAPPQRHGARLHVHLGTSVVLGRLIVEARGDAGGPREIPSGAHGTALLRLESPLAVRRGDRLILRAYSPVHTVGGARVLDPQPPARAVARATDAGQDLDAWLHARIREAGAIGLLDAELPARCGVTLEAARALTRRLAEANAAIAIGAHWIAVEALAAVRVRVLSAVDEAQAADPLAGGVPRATLRGLRGRRWRADVVDHVLSGLLAEGVLSGEDRLVRPDTGRANRDAADTRVRAIVEDAGLKGRTAQELQDLQTEGVERKALAAVLGRLVKARDIERLGDLYVAAVHLEALSLDLRALARAGGGPATVEVGWFKERYGLTRRTAIPLLEWLDRARVTRRQGDARVLVSAS